MDQVSNAPLPPVAPFVPTPKNHKKIWLIGAAVLVVLAVALGAYYWFQVKTKQAGDQATDATTAPTPENPMTAFQKSFAMENYQVNVTNELGSLIYVLYYEHGQLFRVDSREATNNNTIIIKNNRFYDLDVANKLFRDLSVNDTHSLTTLFYYKSITMLDMLMQSETPPITPWSQTTDSSRIDVIGYQTSGRRLLLNLPLGPEKADVKVLVNPTSRLITSAAYKKEQASQWNILNFDYRIITDLDFQKRFPADYQKIQF